MDEFDNVKVVKKANIYFDGKVTSRTVHFSNGEKKTLGIMLPGDYEFGTDQREVMDILAGEMEVLLPGETIWRKISGGESFEIPAKAKFGLKIHKVVDYCCSYY
ncbi:MAG: pyrimidine/purine nucleoside phosphorylase [Leptospiraceae bacterium]|nr:pyrimidine/purine nucleoside phosphorylase [Leptospiraceae bacterium]